MIPLLAANDDPLGGFVMGLIALAIIIGLAAVTWMWIIFPFMVNSHLKEGIALLREANELTRWKIDQEKKGQAGVPMPPSVPKPVKPEARTATGVYRLD